MFVRSPHPASVRRCLVLLVLPTLLLCACTHSEAWRRHRPIAVATTTPPALPTFYNHQLSNGLAVLTAALPTPSIVHVQLTVRVGSAQDPVDKPGTAYLLGRMLQESTKQQNSLQLAKAFADLGSNVQVQVLQDAIHLSVGVIQQHVDKAVQLLAQMLQQPAFARYDFERVYANHIASLQRNQANAAYVAMTTFWREAYGKAHPYDHPVHGTLDPKLLSNQQRQQERMRHMLQSVRNMWQSYVGPHNAALLLSGSITTQQAQQLAQTYFGQWQHRTTPVAVPANPPMPQQLMVHVIPRPNSTQTFVLLGKPIIQPGQPSNAALLVLNEILGGLFSSRLNLILREEKGWTYGVHATLRGMRGMGPLLIYANVKNSYLDSQTQQQLPCAPAALQIMIGQLKLLQQTAPSSKEIQMAKQNLLYALPGGFDTVEAVCRYMASLFVRNLPFDYYHQLLQDIANVTAQQLLAMAKEKLSEQQMHAVLVGDPTYLQPESFQLPNAQIVVHPPIQ